MSKRPTQDLIAGLFDYFFLFLEVVCGFLCLVAACLTTPSLSQSLIGDIDNAMRTFLNYYTVWKQFGGLPEFYNIPQGYTVEKREGYPLRPGKQHLWPSGLVLQTPNPHVFTSFHALQVHFFFFFCLILPVVLDSFPARNYVSPYFFI